MKKQSRTRKPKAPPRKKAAPKRARTLTAPSPQTKTVSKRKATREPSPSSLQQPESRDTSPPPIETPKADREEDPLFGTETELRQHINHVIDSGDPQLKNFLSRLHTLIPQYPAEVVDLTFGVLCLKGLEAEVARHLYQRVRALEAGDTRTADLWAGSFVLLGLYHHQGDEGLLELLPMYLLEDCEFSLGLPWIRSVIASWHQQGDEEKINRAFFGKSRPGRGSFKLEIENLQRNLKIIAAVERLLAQGSSKRAAYAYVSEHFKELGITQRLAPRTIRDIYDERDRIGPNLADYFDPHRSSAALVPA